MATDLRKLEHQVAEKVRVGLGLDTWEGQESKVA